LYLTTEERTCTRELVIWWSSWCVFWGPSFRNPFFLT